MVDQHKRPPHNHLLLLLIDPSIFPPQDLLSHALMMKLKIAPRSSLQFKVGPPFTQTTSLRTILTSDGHTLIPVITPRIDRGFELVDSNWVGYKRNYFTLVSSFKFQGVPFSSFAREKYSIFDDSTKSTKRIMYFGLRLASRCHDDCSNVSLVQHTAKRDRGPQFAPSDQVIVPGDLPLHNVIRESANVRNNGKIAKLDRVFFFDIDTHDLREFGIGGLKHYPSSKISKVARFERVQFTSSINFKKCFPNPKRFILFVELVAYTDELEAIPVASTQTPPLIIRGRSPSNYKESHDMIKDAPEKETIDLEVVGTTDDNEVVAPCSDMLEDLLTYEILIEANDALTMEMISNPEKKTKNKKKAKSKKKSPNTLNETTDPSQVKTKTKKSNNGIQVIKPKKLISGMKPKAPKKKKKKEHDIFDFDPGFIINDESISNAFLGMPSMLGFHFPTTMDSAADILYQPMEPTPVSDNKENVVNSQTKSFYTKKSKVQHTPLSVKSIETIEDTDKDFNDQSFDTSFGLGKLFDGADVPFPPFNKEGTPGKRSLTSMLEMDPDLNFEEELDLFRTKRVQLQLVANIGMKEEHSKLHQQEPEGAPSAFVNFGEFDEFPSFSLQAGF